MAKNNSYPNFKVDFFFEYINLISIEVYELGEYLSTNEQVQNFTSRGTRTIQCK